MSTESVDEYKEQRLEKPTSESEISSSIEMTSWMDCEDRTFEESTSGLKFSGPRKMNVLES